MVKSQYCLNRIESIVRYVFDIAVARLTEQICLLSTHADSEPCPSDAAIFSSCLGLSVQTGMNLLVPYMKTEETTINLNQEIGEHTHTHTQSQTMIVLFWVCWVICFVFYCHFFYFLWVSHNLSITHTHTLLWYKARQSCTNSCSPHSLLICEQRRDKSEFSLILYCSAGRPTHLPPLHHPLSILSPTFCLSHPFSLSLRRQQLERCNYLLKLTRFIAKSWCMRLWVSVCVCVGACRPNGKRRMAEKRMENQHLLSTQLVTLCKEG